MCEPSESVENYAFFWRTCYMAKRYAIIYLYEGITEKLLKYNGKNMTTSVSE